MSDPSVEGVLVEFDKLARGMPRPMSLVTEAVREGHTIEAIRNVLRETGGDENTYDDVWRAVLVLRRRRELQKGVG